MDIKSSPFTSEVKGLLKLLTSQDSVHSEEIEVIVTDEKRNKHSNPISKVSHPQGYIPFSDLLKSVAYDDIARARKKKGMTQKQLADLVGITQPQLSRLEKQPSKASVDLIGKLARALGIKVIIPN